MVLNRLGLSMTITFLWLVSNYTFKRKFSDWRLQNLEAGTLANRWVFLLRLTSLISYRGKYRPAVIDSFLICTLWWTLLFIDGVVHILLWLTLRLLFFLSFRSFSRPNESYFSSRFKLQNSHPVAPSYTILISAILSTAAPSSAAACGLIEFAIAIVRGITVLALLLKTHAKTVS